MASCDRKNALGPESQIDVLDGPQTSNQKTGADQQNDRQREFRHDESAADSTRGDSARDASSSFLAGGPQIPARHSYRGRQSNQDSCEEAKGQGPAEHARIEADLVQTGQVSGLDSQNEADARLGHQQAQQPDMTARVRLSASNCRTIRARLAPSAARMAISRSRLALRASERLATLVAAMRSTQKTAPVSIHNASRGLGPVT